jgi:hypothetical protein
MSDPHSHSSKDSAHGDHGHGHHKGVTPGDGAPPPKAIRLAANYTSGGHEIDWTPNRNLFGFLAVMVVILILSAVGVYQLFVSHTEEQLDDAAAAPSSQLVTLQARNDALRSSYGEVRFEDKPAGYRIPVAQAKKLVLADPSRFAAAPRPEGWIHPDDAAKQATPAPQPEKQ